MRVFDMIKRERRHKKTGILVVCLWMTIAFLAGSGKISDAAAEDFIPGGRRIIVIDPGHGGYDNGALGPDGSVEKELTLNFALILAGELKPAYEVVLTRDGDDHVDLMRRASVANHQQGDIFLSIHNGGGCRYQMDAWSVYYFRKSDPPDGEGFLKTAGPDIPRDDFKANADDSRLHWDRVQLRHLKESRALAVCMKAPFAANPDIREVTVASAALRVLEGVDMPAIIIETGYLTNPRTENRLNDNSFLIDLAKRIKKGLDVYLTR